MATLDLSGKTYGKLTVISKAPSKGTGSLWICKCTCGNVKEFMGNALNRNAYSSCGCTNPRSIDLMGKVFTRLTVVEKVETDKKGNHWKCVCSCGKELIVRGGNLTNNTTKSCGCYKNDKFKELLDSGGGYKFPKTHGFTGKLSKQVWDGMMARCYNPDLKQYHNWGGRGITVCERWHTYENFALDMGEPPDGLKLERTDNNGNYTPENCIWATDIEQNRNRRNNRLLTYKGETKCVTAWAEELKVNPKTLYTRVYLGWTDEQVLGTPLK